MPTLPVPPAAGEGDFEPVSDGMHIGICFMFIDYGSHQENYKGVPKKSLTPKVRIGWEISDELREKADDRTGEFLPKVITKRYTWSTSENANLRKDLEAWRGQKFVDADFGPGGFNVRNLIGVPAMINVANTKKGDKSYCDVIGLGRLHKDMRKPVLVRKPIFLALNKEEWDGNVFDSLSEKAKEFIKQSPEYKALMGVKEAKGNAYADQSGGRYKVDDPALNAAARGDPGYTQDLDQAYRGDRDEELNDQIPF